MNIKKLTTWIEPVKLLYIITRLNMLNRFTVASGDKNSKRHCIGRQPRPHDCYAANYTHGYKARQHFARHGTFKFFLDPHKNKNTF